MIGSATPMLRLSRDFGKREKFAAVRSRRQDRYDRHCERSEAIHLIRRRGKMDCFVAIGALARHSNDGGGAS